MQEKHLRIRRKKQLWAFISVGIAREIEQNKIKDQVYFYIHSRDQFIGKKKFLIV